VLLPLDTSAWGSQAVGLRLKYNTGFLGVLVIQAALTKYCKLGISNKNLFLSYGKSTSKHGRDLERALFLVRSLRLLAIFSCRRKGEGAL